MAWWLEVGNIVTRFSPGFIASSSLSSGFTPASISNMLRWYDAGLSTYVGGTWQDLAGIASVEQPTVGLRPVLNPTGMNGQPSLTFDGTGMFLSNNIAFMRSQTALTCIVITDAAAQNGRRLICEGHNVNTNGIYCPCESSGATPFQRQSAFIRLDNFTTVFQQIGEVVHDSTPRMWGSKINQTAETVTQFVGTVSGSAVGFANPIGTLSVNRFAIGCLLRTTAGSHWGGELGAAMVYGKILSSEEFAAIESYYQGRGMLV